MIKTLRITSILAVALAVVLVVFSVVFGVRSDTDIVKLLDEPNIIEKFNKSSGNKTTRGSSDISPLVQQAGSFALYLNPPKPIASRPTISRTGAVTRPPSATPKFKVLATSYCKNRPEQSIALIDEPGKGLNWVRQSGTVGHLFVEEIKDGIVVVKDGNGTFELIAEQKPHVSLLEGAPSVGSKAEDIPSSSETKTNVEPSTPAPVKSPAYSGKTISRATKLPRAPQLRKTNEEESAMTELAERLAQLQRTFKSDKAGSGYTAQEKAAMMNTLIEDFKSRRSSKLSDEDTKRIDILGKELKKKMEEPESSGRK
jgi:hypothetical protein